MKYKYPKWMYIASAREESGKLKSTARKARFKSTNSEAAPFHPLTKVVPASAVPKKPAKKPRLPFSVGSDHSKGSVHKAVTGPPKNAKELQAKKKRAAAKRQSI